MSTYNILDWKVHFKFVYSYQMWKWRPKEANDLSNAIQPELNKTKQKTQKQNKQKNQLLASFSFTIISYCHVILKMGRSCP